MPGKKGMFDITSATTTTLISEDEYQGQISQITICNQHSSTAAVVDLYYDDGKGNADSDCYIIKNCSIPAGVTALIDHSISFDNAILSLKLTNTGGTPLSVIIK